jgi:Flp pilus assembly protein TadB
MVLGIILILAGMLIAIYPPLLSIIVAMVLVLAGIFVFTVSYRYKKMAKKFNDPFIDFFMRL